MTGASAPGALALVGGDEFRPGNAEHDRFLADVARRHGGPAYVIATAAREHPDAAVATAVAWFATLGFDVSELPLRTRRQAQGAATAALAARGSLFYLAGGDPGRVPQVLAGTAAWDAILTAWRRGAVLAGSSAGAMALGAWTMIRESVPGDARRSARPALGIVPGIAVVPHFDTFGHRWLPSVRPVATAAGISLVGIDERTAAVWQSGSWRAMGSGSVHVLGPAGDAMYPAGAEIGGLPGPDTAIDGPGGNSDNLTRD